MRNTVLLNLAVLSLVIAGCGKEEKAKVSSEIRSYIMELVQDGAVSVRHQIEPAFDANGRLSSIVTESRTLNKDGETKSLSKSTSTYVYAESFHTAAEVNVLEGDLAFFEKPTVMELTFDEGWKLTEAYFDQLQSTESYEYDGDRMTRYTHSGISHETPTDITWKDGDIVSIADDSATATITYLPEENPFKKGIDPTLDNLLPVYYTYMITGSHSAHLPDTYTNVSTTVKTYKYEYKKDKHGRITEITVKGEGETSHNVIRIQY